MRVYTKDGVVIARVMRDLLNTWPDKPVEIRLDDLGAKAPSMMLQQLQAAEKRKSYVNGSYIGVWNFAVYMRVYCNDTVSRLDATACLNDLSDWLTEMTSDGKFVRLPVIDDRRSATSIALTATPSVAARYENGTEDYQMLMSLEYFSRRN